MAAALASFPALEDALAEDPFDETRWIVLEDWLLENSDPRAVLVMLEKQGVSTKAALETLGKQLLGPAAASILPHIYQQDWRAGFLRECQYTGTADMLDSFLAQPASSLLRSFALTTYAKSLDAALAAFDRAPCIRSMRVLTVSSWGDAKAPVISSANLRRMRHLDRLILRGVYVDRPVDVRVLVLAPMRLMLDDVLTQLAHHAWEKLRVLELELPDLLGEGVTLSSLRPVSRYEVAPQLESLVISNVPRFQMTAISDYLEPRLEGRDIALWLRE